MLYVVSSDILQEVVIEMSLREYFSLKKDHMKIYSKPEKSLNTMLGRHDNVDYIIFCFI